MFGLAWIIRSRVGAPTRGKWSGSRRSRSMATIFRAEDGAPTSAVGCSDSPGLFGIVWEPRPGANGLARAVIAAWPQYLSRRGRRSHTGGGVLGIAWIIRSRVGAPPRGEWSGPRRNRGMASIFRAEVGAPTRAVGCSDSPGLFGIVWEPRPRGEWSDPRRNRGMATIFRAEVGAPTRAVGCSESPGLFGIVWEPRPRGEWSGSRRDRGMATIFRAEVGAPTGAVGCSGLRGSWNPVGAPRPGERVEKGAKNSAKARALAIFWPVPIRQKARAKAGAGAFQWLHIENPYQLQATRHTTYRVAAA